MKDSEGRKQLITDGGWIALGQVLAVGGTLLGIRVLTELTPPQVYGTVTLLVGISALGLGTLYGPVMQAVLRYFTQYSQHELPGLRYVVMRILFRRTVWGIVILGVGWPLAHYVWGMPWTMAVWVLPLVICDGLRTLETVFLNAARNTRMHALLSTVEAWAKPIGAISALLILGPYTESILAGYTISTSMVLFSYYRWGTPVAMLKWPVRMYDDAKARSSIEKYAHPLLPSSAIGWVTGVGDRYLIGLMIGVEQVGIYSAIYGLVSRPVLNGGQHRRAHRSPVLLLMRGKQRPLWLTFVAMEMVWNYRLNCCNRIRDDLFRKGCFDQSVSSSGVLGGSGFVAVDCRWLRSPRALPGI